MRVSQSVELTFSFHRRRYGKKQFYTWAYIKGPDGSPLSLGDPWPCVNPKKSELIEAARIALARLPDEGVVASV